MIGTIDMGDGFAVQDEEIATASPALPLVATERNTPRDWVAAGMAHAHMLLDVPAAG